jgi:probable F420-dependent oxidoreductase
MFGTTEQARALGEAADEFGIESLWTVEHVVVPKDYASPYPYSSTGRMPGGEETPIPDPLIWLSFVASVTTRVRLATGILILPQRSPVVLAKECASLDVLSGGRLTLGVGIGWLEEEFDAIGVPFEERVDRTEESILALRALWSKDETFEGRFYKFKDARSFPKPAQPTGIPIVVGGHTKASARRAGRLGDGFFPARGDFASLFDECRKAANEAGRDPDSIELTAGGPPSIDFAKQLEDLGASRIVTVQPAFDPDEIKRTLGELHDNLISKLS